MDAIQKMLFLSGTKLIDFGLRDLGSGVFDRFATHVGRALVL